MGMGFVVFEGLLTAVCGGFNCLYFHQYYVRPSIIRQKRAAAMALALLNGGIAVESIYSLALFALHRWRGPEDALFAPVPWLAARFILLLATGLVTVLIIRQERRP
jgi:hypothetical protein